MTASIRPIFLAVDNDQILGYDPLRQNDNFYQCKYVSNRKEFRKWCKGNSRNSRVVLIAHQKVDEYKSLLETPKDKIPRTWQVFDTSVLDDFALPDLIKRYNIKAENEAQATHQLFSFLTHGIDVSKVYESLTKSDAKERILELARAHRVVPKSSALVPIVTTRIAECYYHIETEFEGRIINIDAFMPSRFGEDAFFSRTINPESAINNDYKFKPKLRSVLAQFFAWIQAEDEPATHVLFFCHSSDDNYENIFKKETIRARLQLPQQSIFANLYTILKKQFNSAPEHTFELCRLAGRFNIQQSSHLQTMATLVKALSGQALTKALISDVPLSSVLPTQLPEEVIPSECGIFYFKEQERNESSLVAVVEDVTEN